MNSASPPVAIARVSLPQLVAHALDDAVDLAGEAVDHAGADRVDGRLADDRARLLEVDAHELGGALVQGLHGDLDPGGDDAAEELAVGRDDVVVDRGAEVDHHAGGVEAVVGGDRVDQAVGAELARVVDADGHAGLQAGPDEDRVVAEVAVAHALVLGLELGDDGRDDRRVEVVEGQAAQLEQVRERGPELVGGRRGHGGKAPVLDEGLAAEGAEVRLGVADVDDEEHRGRFPTLGQCTGGGSRRQPRHRRARPPDVPPARERASQRVARLRGDAAAGRRPRGAPHRGLVLDRPRRDRRRHPPGRGGPRGPGEAPAGAGAARALPARPERDHGHGERDPHRPYRAHRAHRRGADRVRAPARPGRARRHRARARPDLGHDGAADRARPRPRRRHLRLGRIGPPATGARTCASPRTSPAGRRPRSTTPAGSGSRRGPPCAARSASTSWSKTSATTRSSCSTSTAT